MQDEHHDESNDPAEERLDPRARLLANLTPRQRYVLYLLLAAGVVFVFWMELSSH